MCGYKEMRSIVHCASLAERSSFHVNGQLARVSEFPQVISFAATAIKIQSDSGSEQTCARHAFCKRTNER